MTKKIQLIVGSTRENRVGAQVAEWVATHARAHDGIELEVIDLKDVALPFFTGPIPPSFAPDSTEAGIAWAKRIAEGDGYIFVTAEYNRSIPAPLKNAIDYLVAEWKSKPALIVSYGYIDGGQNVTKHLRDAFTWLKMATLDSAINLTITQDMFDGSAFKDIDGAFADYEVNIDEALKTLAAHELAAVAA